MVDDPKIAIVIDDFGGADTTGVKEMFSINCPMTFAVMPNLPHSEEHASEAVAAGYQVIYICRSHVYQGATGWRYSLVMGITLQ
ncbi:MAG: Divergent polysaccharide deacetylase [Pelotomaculum sp. PtaB.Bin013]|uniref:Divergent polysaccharide deacetylase family protein n=1 Tax=Pelotomaculum isophthalicicum JI TaxID=947010 RepID=A0A9X4H404_9FIRM|nr:divergent polysaccharide deacetylase family protein [Pelotomaculum isophthalicicum]MDF9409975.1 divergent polysaccharide deacetylase family protein [Pelotomaculum isophthalicicum JI]OPX92239.1 MAG: Divergent polysaccharide deacetylase [Pelotomaculum sp. PtaB.Bin013]